jgi:light-harvesting protein B-800-850 alpha chain
MNQGRIWCVVNPTVGLPLFLGSVAVTSLIVHYSVLSHVSWFGSYWNGSAAAKTAAAVDTSTKPVAVTLPDGKSIVITVTTPAGTTATAQTEPSAAKTAAPDKLALAAPGPK